MHYRLFNGKCSVSISGYFSTKVWVRQNFAGPDVVLATQFIESAINKTTTLIDFSCKITLILNNPNNIDSHTVKSIINVLNYTGFIPDQIVAYVMLGRTNNSSENRQQRPRVLSMTMDFFPMPTGYNATSGPFFFLPQFYLIWYFKSWRQVIGILSCLGFECFSHSVAILVDWTKFT